MKIKIPKPGAEGPQFVEHKAATIKEKPKSRAGQPKMHNSGKDESDVGPCMPPPRTQRTAGQGGDAQKNHGIDRDEDEDVFLGNFSFGRVSNREAPQIPHCLVAVSPGGLARDHQSAAGASRPSHSGASW
eukprot:CAMPEP_0206457660 /NCGR_PEP_ID=MMETSP0324_2-20121206/23100_1 /ASSEMBLY_ACC=CAM_ASM_000836 /TAXON_ID=2866 /ORGANISM="Crypthecodinium cohnii, Strain Seligo" /LENGTH=129 /DNA_ID=CAMNT_0053928837 /DNA_START=292 /DNA_END=680 /DNA_ORIENTATION=+